MQKAIITDTQKIAHDTLLDEIHTIDDVAEKHGQVIISITAALIAYSATRTPDQIVIISILGMLINIEWVLHNIRFRRVFRSCHDRLFSLEKEMGINALRPLKKPHRRFVSFDGFTLLMWFAVFILIFWTVMFIRNI